MEKEEEYKSISELLPEFADEEGGGWSDEVVEALSALLKGPSHSNVDSGELLFLAISDIRSTLSLLHPLSPFTQHGFSLFFDDLLSRAEASNWFDDVLPAMAKLILKLPSFLEAHYRNADRELKPSLRLLASQQSGMVFLSQELIGSLLACSFFCLFPVTDRDAKRLPTINFDEMFASLYDSYSEAQENKIKCITHYFVRICSDMPGAFVSFERKVLPWENIPSAISYPGAEFWSKSSIPLCHFEIFRSGLIENHSSEGLEVDFANKYLGGGALNRGCVQEEIRFMISPELIVGMLFLPAMADNESIEIVGAERFSKYTGYASTFRFSGNHVDERVLDIFGRRKTRIIAIDALCFPGKRQFGDGCLLREVNKAYCGFLDHSHCRPYLKQDQEKKSNNMICETQTSSSNGLNSPYVDKQEQIGIVTGNWGCGAFGGDPQLKATLQWISASQARRPSISYYTFSHEALQSLDQVTQWVMSHEWTVGELWDVLVDYSSQRLKSETKLGFFSWLLPSMSASTPMMLD